MLKYGEIYDELKLWLKMVKWPLFLMLLLEKWVFLFNNIE